MKIALVILHADPARGGAERYTLDLAAALAKREHDVSLLATSYADVPARVARVELPARGATRARRYRQMLDSLDAHADRAGYDIIHAMLPVRRCDVYHPHAGIAVAATRRWNIHFNPRRKLMAGVERELLTGDNDPPVVLCLSEYVKRSIRAHYALDDPHMPILFNAVDLNRFEPPAQRPMHDRAKALFIGHDAHRKGLPETLAALRLLHEQSLELCVVGRSDLIAKVPPDAFPQVTFAGEAADPRPFYREADFLVLPTKHDPCSLVVLEALAMGVPVISTKFNGACEIMTDGVHGFVLDDPRDVNALADAMRRMLDPQLRQRMSQACLELRPRLSYEAHLRTLLGIYQNVIDSRRAARVPTR